MSPIIIALIGGVLYLVQITILFNIFHINEKAKCMVKLWLANLAILILIFWAVYQYNIIPGLYLMDGFKINLFLTIFYYTAGFFGGILQLYNLADRGFSLRILIDIQESGQQGLTLDEIMKRYSQGKGIAWMYQKRLNDMLTNGLITSYNHIIKNTLKGTRLSMLFIKLRQIVSLR